MKYGVSSLNSERESFWILRAADVDSLNTRSARLTF